MKYLYFAQKNCFKFVKFNFQMSDEKTVTPLTSDPKAFAEYAEKLGLDLNSASFYDIYGFDADLYEFTPKPVYSVIFLFSIGEKDGFLETRYKKPLPEDQIPTPRPWFSLQTVHNACGTMAILHSILNNLEHIKIKPDSWLSKFVEKTAKMTPEQRAKLIHNDDTLFSFHEQTAKNSDVAIPEKVAEHFVAFTEVGGKLWELDGRKPQPICHGEVKDVLAESLAYIQKEFMPNLANSLMVSLISFSKPPSE